MNRSKCPMTARQTFLFLLLALFTTEYFIMTLPSLGGDHQNGLVRALLDASLLSALLLPIAYIFIYRPQRRQQDILAKTSQKYRELERSYRRLEAGTGILASNFQQMSGRPLFEDISRRLAEILSADAVFVGRLHAETGKVDVLGGHDHGGPMQSFSYQLDKDPCKEMVEKGACIYPDDNCQSLPDKELLDKVNIGGFVNTPLHSRTGDVIGFLSILNGQPIDLAGPAEQIIQAYVSRTTSELEQVRTAEQLDHSRTLYRDLFSSIRDTIIIADQNRTIIDANQPALHDMFGYELEEISGQRSRLLYADDADFTRAGELVFDHTENTGGVLLSLSFRRKNGSTFPAEAYALKLVAADGKAVGNIAVIRDISQKIKTEDEKLLLERLLQQSQKMEAIGKLAGGVAHDFNNMLQVVVGYGEALAMKLSGDEQLRSFADNILLAAEKATHMTRNLLAFSRKQQLSLKPVDLNQLIHGFSGFFRRVLSAEISFSFTPSSDELYVMADAHQLEQVFMNLATNARDAMPCGGHLTIKTSSIHLNQETLQRYGREQAGVFARIEFVDSGQGISEPDLDRVFDPFFTTKEEGKGTGLGLAMSFGIVTQHKGIMHASSTPGEGACFYIDLPLIQASALSTDDRSLKNNPHAGHETILLAEDRPDVSDALAATLEQYGYTVVVAGNGNQALDMINTQPSRFDLLLLDVSMPGQSGPSIFAQVKEDNPDLKAIFLSGYVGDALNQLELDTSGIDLLSKPISAGVLLEKVRAVLDKPS